MIDRATQVAAFLAEREDRPEEPDAIWAEMQWRWPGLTREEASRGAAIAAELIGGGIAEKVAEAETLERALAASGPHNPEAIAAAIAGWGETEFREIAEGTGIPLEDIRTAMEALQRGDPLPLADDAREEGGHAGRI